MYALARPVRALVDGTLSRASAATIHKKSHFIAAGNTFSRSAERAFHQFDKTAA